MNRFLRCSIVLASWAGPLAGASRAADAVEAALTRAVIGPDRTLAEVQDYLERYIPPVPKAATAEEWTRIAERTRAEVLDRVIFRGEAAAWRDAPTRVDWLETIEGGPGYKIKKLRYEALPGLWIPALLYEPDNLKGKVPAILNVHGHERIGKAADYKQLNCINQAKRGMLALNVDWVGMGQLRTPEFEHQQISDIDLTGTPGVAAFYLNMRRGLDILLAHEHADPARVAVTGLSGGSWQTIFLSAFDTRVTLANPVAGYSSYRTRIREFSDLGEAEQTPVDLATVTDYATMTGMMAPRPLLLTYNAKDNCCFAAGHALPPLIEAATPIYDLFGARAKLTSHINHDPGTHNYEIDNRQAFYKVLADNFGTKEAPYPVVEIPSTPELKTIEQLNIPLPDDNVGLRGLALKLAGPLPRRPELPDDPLAARAWRSDRRESLRSIVRAKRYNSQAEQVGSEETDGVLASSHKVRIGGTWTIPVVELSRGEPVATTILLADAGRSSPAAIAKARELLGAKHRVLAVDPWNFGESQIKRWDYLFSIMISCIGDRPLGLQASQVGSIAAWARSSGKTPANIVAIGPRASVVALVAAGLDEGAVGSVEVHHALGSLKELTESRTSANQAPELFCFGLLESFDIKQLVALAAPRPVTFVGASPRAKAELAGLKAWYAGSGVDHEPIR